MLPINISVDVEKIVYNPVNYFHQIMLRHLALFSCEAPGDCTCLINQKSDKKIYENFSLALCHTQFMYLSLLRAPSLHAYFEHQDVSWKKIIANRNEVVCFL